MSLPRDVYWTVENEKGNLARGWSTFTEYQPITFRTRKEAKTYCSDDERPVKVKMVRVK